MAETPLDHAFIAMEAAPEDDAARLRFYERLTDAELVLLLAKEAEGDQAVPEVFEVDGVSYVLAFDREERLTQFVGRAAPYVALSGRALAGMLAEQGAGVSLNPGVAPSSYLLPPDAVAWLAQTLGRGPQEADARVSEVFAPGGLPEALVKALDAKLAAAEGLARKAYLAEASYEDGTRGHLLGLTGTAPGAEDAIAHAVNEALVFSGIEAGALDVVFLRDSDPVANVLSRVGLRFDLPQPPELQAQVVTAPGSDPEKPPRLR